MFDIGLFELVLIAFVLLVVMGPEKLPEVARQGAFFIRKLRSWVVNMKSEMDVNDPGAMRSLQEASREIAELKASIAQMGQDLMVDVEQAENQMQSSVVELDAQQLTDDEVDNHFAELANRDVQPALLDDEVAGKTNDAAGVKSRSKKAK